MRIKTGNVPPRGAQATESKFNSAHAPASAEAPTFDPSRDECPPTLRSAR